MKRMEEIDEIGMANFLMARVSMDMASGKLIVAIGHNPVAAHLLSGQHFDEWFEATKQFLKPALEAMAQEISNKLVKEFELERGKR
jgi:peptidyl-tRNA hydrolase